MDDLKATVTMVSKDKCTGCSACYNSCPKHAISMIPDKEGFVYPQINEGLCVNCSLCAKKCPILNKNYYTSKEALNIAYAVKSHSSQDRALSSSGGFFPVLARYVLEHNGIVVGAAFDKNYCVEHVMVGNFEELEKIQGSKYLQSSINDIYSDVELILNRGTLVLFSGLACQISGLKSFLGKEYSNLICVDLICMGVPSPLVWANYIKVKFPNEKIANINFKDKRNGWHRFTVVIQTEKREVSEIGKHNEYMLCMFKTYSIRPSCFNCEFKNLSRVSDFTMSDCWGIEIINSSIDDNKGVSAVLIHTERAVDIWREIASKFEYIEITEKDISQHNPMIYRCIEPHNTKRKLFFWTMNHVSSKVAFYIFCEGWKNTLRRLLGRKV